MLSCADPIAARGFIPEAGRVNEVEFPHKFVVGDMREIISASCAIFLCG